MNVNELRQWADNLYLNILFSWPGELSVLGQGEGREEAGGTFLNTGGAGNRRNSLSCKLQYSKEGL